MSGFVYVWFDIHRRMYYIGSHWGTPDDGYVCSSPWMLRAYKNRPHHFKRRVLKVIRTTREELLKEEQRWLNMIKPEEMVSGSKSRDEVRYYNLLANSGHRWHTDPVMRVEVGQKISAAKTGKKTGPFSEERKRAISEGKRRKFEERRALTGSSYSPETIQSWVGKNVGKTMTPESNAKRSESLKLAYAEGRKKRRGS